MTAAALAPSRTYNENGVSTVFAVPFRFVSQDSLSVQRISPAGVVTNMVLGSDYSVTGGNSDAGGTLTMALPGPMGTKLRIRRATPRSQQMDYTTGDTFPAQSHEDALDKLTLIDQEQDVKIDDTALRALMVPDGETAPVLPGKSARANRFLAFDADGIPVFWAGTGSDPSLRWELLGTTGATQVRTGNGRTIESRLNDRQSIEDFRTAEGPAGDKAAFEAACMACRIFDMPRDEYDITGAVIPANAKVQLIEGKNTKIWVDNSLNAVGVRILKKQFLAIDGIRWWSRGSKNDGMNVSAVVWDVGCSYQAVRHCYTRYFSGAGLTPVQCVAFHFENNNCVSMGDMYRFLPDPATNIQCTAVTIRGGYLSGATSGIFSYFGVTDLLIDDVITEYCGDVNSANFAAYNITGGLVVETNSCYFEACFKNRRLHDCLHMIQHPLEFEDAPWDSSYTWGGTAFDQRGYMRLTNRTLTIAEIVADPTVGPPGGGLRIMGPIGFGGDATNGFMAHWRAPEVRWRLEATNPNGVAFDIVNGGAGVLSTGFFAVQSGGGNRLLIEQGVGEGMRITGNNQIWLQGQRVLTVRQPNIANIAAAPTAADHNAVLQILRTHGLMG